MKRIRIWLDISNVELLIQLIKSTDLSNNFTVEEEESLKDILETMRMKVNDRE